MDNSKNTNYMTFAILIGISIGLSLGKLLLNNSLIGLAICISLGVIVGEVLNKKKGYKN